MIRGPVGMKDMSEQFEGIDQAGAGTIEQAVPVRDENPALSVSRQAANLSSIEESINLFERPFE